MKNQQPPGIELKTFDLSHQCSTTLAALHVHVHVLGYCRNAMSSFSLYSFEHNSFQTAETSDTRDFPTVTDTFTVYNYVCSAKSAGVCAIYNRPLADDIML